MKRLATFACFWLSIAACAADPAASAPAPVLQRMSVPRVTGRLHATDIGLVVNTADAYSVQVGRYYAVKRGLKPEQILRVELPVRGTLTPEEFSAFDARVKAFFGERTQALVLAWTAPWAVSCNSITGALALGFDGQLCNHTCAASSRSAMFNTASSRPFKDLGLRPSMLLASKNVAAAKALIDRGVASDGSAGKRGAPPSHAYFMITPDLARSARAPLFPPPGYSARANIEIHVEQGVRPRRAERTIVYQTGLERVPGLEMVDWVPGALADHLTSTGGVLDNGNGQMSAVAWLASGATASYGTVSEPCSHWQKFPHPQALLLHYAQGETAIEAYWKSVMWPQQGVFIGEPLAAPFSKGP